MCCLFWFVTNWEKWFDVVRRGSGQLSRVKIYREWPQGKRELLRVSGKVELSRVRVTEGKIAANMGNPGEIDFCSSWCEVRVSEGWSYRDCILYKQKGYFGYL